MMLFVKCAENQCAVNCEKRKKCKKVKTLKPISYHSVESVAEFKELGLCVAISKGLD